MQFGVFTTLQNRSWPDLLDLWRHVEATGWDIACAPDHLAPVGPTREGTNLEALSSLSALAALVPRIRLGTIVLSNTFRRPAVLAKVAAQIDVISGGRLVLGLGAGWHPAEQEAYGIRLPPVRERLERLDEACQVVRSLWTQRRSTFHGRYYRLSDAPLDPKPVQTPHPPLMIGGGGERVTLRLVAAHADAPPRSPVTRYRMDTTRAWPVRPSRSGSGSTRSVRRAWTPYSSRPCSVRCPRSAAISTALSPRSHRSSGRRSMSVASARALDRIAALGLLAGATFGLAGTLVGSPYAQACLWAIDSVGLVVATSLLSLKYFRAGVDIIAGGFLVFPVGEGVLLSGPAAGPGGSVPAFAAGTALWAAALALISAPRQLPAWLRPVGIVAACLFAVTAARIYAGEALRPTSSPLPFFGYPLLVATLLGWAWMLVHDPPQSGDVWLLTS